MILTVDGTDYPDLIANVKRKAELRPSDISGFLMDGSYFNDVIGMYLSYDVEISVPYGKEEIYADLYEVLSDPIDGHSLVLPYNQTEVELVGRVEVISDTYHHHNSRGVHFWRDTVFTIIANHPTKAYTLGEMVERGMTPLPNIADVEDGAIYEYHAGSGWQPITIEDADEVAY